MILLVGDNPFHGVSHLSQERAKSRGLFSKEHAADLVTISLQNGADGFMFSVSETTLDILRILALRGIGKELRLYAVTPAAREFIGALAPIGMSGLARNLAKQMLAIGNFEALALALYGAVRADAIALTQAFVSYEFSRIRSSSHEAILESILLHEVVTDMALALDLRDMVNSYIDFVKRHAVVPGFQTRNFAYLLSKFSKWGIDTRELVISAAFNKAGFQMTPSRVECEKALASLPNPNVVAISILAAGYLQLAEAIEYIRALPNLKGVAVGVSNENQARETFSALQVLNSPLRDPSRLV